jgi:hypothetical protein
MAIPQPARREPRSLPIRRGPLPLADLLPITPLLADALGIIATD